MYTHVKRSNVHIKRSFIPCHHSVYFGNSKTPSIHRRFGSAILSQLAFPRGKRPEFPMGEIPMGRYGCLKKSLTADAIRKIRIGLEIVCLATDLQRVSSRATGVLWIYVEVLDGQSTVVDVS